MKIDAAKSGGYLEPTRLIAVKERPLTVQCVSLPDLRQYVAKPVIVSANVTSAPASEDMKLHGTVGLKLSILSLSGTARGYVDGDVYVESTPFRIGDGEGTSFTAEMNHLPSSEKGYMLPVELRRWSGEFGAVGDPQRNNLVHILREAERRGQKLLFLGKLDEADVFHAEAVVSPSREMYFLSVRQPLTRLEVG